MLGKYSNILSAGIKGGAYFSVLTSPKRTEITKPVLNNNTSIRLTFSITTKVRKKRKNLKINLKGGRLKKLLKSRSSALSEDWLGLKLPEPHVNGEDLLHVVSCQFILLIRIIHVFYPHYAAQALNLGLPVTDKTRPNENCIVRTIWIDVVPFTVTR